MLGRDENLTGKYLQQVSAKLFSAKNLGGGLGRKFSEEKEHDIGAEIGEANQAGIMRELEPIVRSPPSSYHDYA